MLIRLSWMQHTRYPISSFWGFMRMSLGSNSNNSSNLGRTDLFITAEDLCPALGCSSVVSWLICRSGLVNFTTVLPKAQTRLTERYPAMLTTFIVCA